MSRLTDLLRQARKADKQLGEDLEREVTALMKRRAFGLVFERHHPEAVELPGRAVRRGDKVRVLPARGEVKTSDDRLWRVERIERADGARVAHLLELGAEEPQSHKTITDDLVVVAEFNDRVYPGLIETGRVERGGDKPFHTVINAENFHALEMLTYTHRGTVDAIYIDPPYNTGAKDWKYNNNYVEGDDDYRHSKWLAFMERRLEIARELLNPQASVLIVTIDEKEYLRLGMLLEQTFPEARIQMVSTVTNPAGTARLDSFNRINEFIYFVRIGLAEIYPDEVPDSAAAEMDWRTFRRQGASNLRHTRPNQFYPIYINDSSHRIEFIGEPLPPGVDRHSVPDRSGCTTVFPLRKDGTEMMWSVVPDAARRKVERGFLRAKPSFNEPQKYIIRYITSGREDEIAQGLAEVESYRPDGSAVITYRTSRKKPPTTHWSRPSHEAYRSGTNILRALMPDRRFPFPKSLFAVEDSLRYFILENPNAIVLDFFSGSGTTAHAVMRLNKQDGGRRQCISVTNNEVSAEEEKRLSKQGHRSGDQEWEALGICDYITKPRITAAITGRTPEGDPITGDYKFTDEFPMSEGFEENAAFFTLTYEAPLSVRHNRAFAQIAPTLWMRAGAQGRIITDLRGYGWDVAETYGVLEDLDRAGLFVARVTAVESVRTAFIVTDDDSAFQMVCRDLPSQVLPVQLYESYLQNFELRGGR